ncbi:hypothetical protein Tco_0126833 [Tanacetum coccineum]
MTSPTALWIRHCSSVEKATTYFWYKIYVDDIIFAASTPDCISQSPRGIFINQSKYALESLKKYGYESCDPVDTPMVEKSKLDEEEIRSADHVGCKIHAVVLLSVYILLGDRLLMATSIAESECSGEHWWLLLTGIQDWQRQSSLVRIITSRMQNTSSGLIEVLISNFRYKKAFQVTADAPGNIHARISGPSALFTIDQSVSR